MLRAVFFGLPTAGKSTISALAAKRLGVPQVNVGQLLRELGLDGCDGRQRDGDLIIACMADVLTPLRSYLLDGFPRDQRQFAWFERSPFAAGCRYFFLDLDPDVVPQRFLHRRFCAACRRADYSGAVLCRHCSGPLRRRSDATGTALHNRLESYRRDEQPVIERLDQHHRLASIPVTGDLIDDLRSVLKAVSGEQRTTIKEGRRRCSRSTAPQ